MLPELKADSLGLVPWTRWLKPKERFPTQWGWKTGEQWCVLEAQRIDLDRCYDLTVVRQRHGGHVAIWGPQTEWPRRKR